MNSEDHVIELDREITVRVESLVLKLHCGVKIHFDVEDAVESKPDHVEDDEVHVEPLHTGRGEVENNLWVERDRPEEEVQPTCRADQLVDELEVDDVDSDSGRGRIHYVRV